jgi:hypothetical protein
VRKAFSIQQEQRLNLYFRRRNAVCASPFASALFSRGTCEMENFKARASLRQVQCKE